MQDHCFYIKTICQYLQTGSRNEAIVYSTYSFFRKLAGAISASLGSFTLAFIGYNVEAAVQTAEVTNRLWKAYTGIYAGGYLLEVLALLLIYPLTKRKTEEMLKALAEKRKNAA